MIVSVALAVALVAPAAEARKVATVALVSAKADVPTHWKEALQRAASDNTERAWVPPPAIALEEAQAALGCSAWDDVCAGQVTAMTGAAVGIVVDIVGVGTGLKVSVTEVRAGSGSQRQAETLSLDSRGASDLELARQFVRAASRGPVAFVTVEADEVGAEALVDGVRIGDVPVRAALSPGEHELILKKEGKAPVLKLFVVSAGQNPTLGVTFHGAGASAGVATTVGTSTPAGPVKPGVPAVKQALAPRDHSLGWTLTAIGGGAAIVGAAVGIPWLLAYTDTPLCQEGRPDRGFCYPSKIQVYGGLVHYEGASRDSFFTDFALATSGSLIAVGVGAVLLGTGLLLVAEPDDAATAPAVPAAP